MEFDEILTQAIELLQRQGRISYGALKRRFHLDDEYLQDLKDELIAAQRVAVDEGGKVLAWTGNSSLVSSVQSLESEGQGRTLTVQTLDSRRQTLDAAERRQLTVMFCDLVGSTALSTQLDPEELREVVRVYQETCTEVIRRYDGHIAQHLGDGLLVYFGYPAAHEDDAQRAVRAGLEIVQALQKRVPSPLVGEHVLRASEGGQGEGAVGASGRSPLQVRIGIHTGLVVIGEIGSSEKREILALGETPNLAARIQGQANPDEVVISATTYHLVEGLFECEDRGEPDLKGVATPLTLYRVLQESETHSRFQVVARRGLTPLVGREHEFGLLCERWERVKDGVGQVVLLSGEPGIGKSRLVEALKESVEQKGSRCLELRCSPYTQNSALAPVIEHLQRVLQFRPDDTPDEKLRKLSCAPLQTETIPLLATLLSLPHPKDFPALTLSPQKQKEKTLEALVTWLGAEAKQHPVVYAWEDLHWADPSTLELLTLFLAQVLTTRMLAVLTFRPEFVPPWGAHSYLSQLTLSRLGRAHVETMVEKVTGGRALSTDVIQQIVSKTDGVPLFIEELTKTVLEAVECSESVGSEGRLGRSVLSVGIPATLQDALMARLDRLGAAKEVAQVGAVLGREFSYELLHAVSAADESTLQRELKQLVEAELVYQRGLPPQVTYLFKHVLIQDTAYQSLLKSTRQQYHQQIAQVLEERFPDTKTTQPELLAYHYTEAGLVEQAIPYWQKAGQRASQRSAPTEAIAHLTTGLELLNTLPETPERTEQKFALHFALAQLYTMRGQFQQAIHQLREQCLTLAQQMGDSSRLLQAQWMMGQILFHIGEVLSAREHVERALALFDPRQHRSRAVQDLGVTSQCYLSWGLWFLGYPDQALATSHKALALARELSHSLSEAFALIFAAGIHQFRGDGHTAQELAEKAIALGQEQGFPVWLAFGLITRGWVIAGQGQEEEGIAQMRQGLTAWRARGTEASRPVVLAMLAEAYEKVGQAEAGLTVLAEALALVDTTGERIYEAELYRLKGELTLQQSGVCSPESEAESCFLKAINIAQKQQAKSWELRATMSLARLWQQQGKLAEAHAMLSEVYNWFTEGFDTKDLQEAKTLLGELNR